MIIRPCAEEKQEELGPIIMQFIDKIIGIARMAFVSLLSVGLSSCALISDNIVDGREGTAAPPTRYRQEPLYQPTVRPAVVKTINYDQYPHRGATAAILTFDARAGVSPDDVALLADRFAVELGQKDTYKLISRSKMKEILEIQKYSASCSSTECAIEAGQLLGVEYMIYGSIGRIGSMFTINAYITSVEKGSMVGAATVDISGQIEDLLTEGMPQAVNRLLGAVATKASEAR